MELNMLMPKSVIVLIHKYCQPGIAYIHTRDGGEFKLKKTSFELCELLKIQSECMPLEPIHVNKISRDIFYYIAKYLTYHDGVKPAEIAQPIRSVIMSNIVEHQWDADFADSMSKIEIFQIMLGANYIDCKSLLRLMSAKIATLIKGKSPDEISDFFSQPDTIRKNTKAVQQDIKRDICFCGFVWSDKKNTGEKLEETDQEEVELKEEIHQHDEALGLEPPQAVDDGSLQE